MPVIAMTREMGSLGKDVALGVAEALNLTLIQHEIVDHVADKMHLGASAVNRFLEGKAGLLERWGIDQKTVSLYTAEEILDIASQGNVLIRGWGAAYLLQPVAHVLCVRVCAPLETRAKTLMARIGIDDETVAQKEIEKNDAAHTKTMQQLFHAEWRNPLLYDLVLNSARIPVATCVEMLTGLAAQPTYEETAASRAQLARLTLDVQIRAALKSNPMTRRLDTMLDITLAPDTGQVLLSGMVDDDSLNREVETVVAAVPGVQRVDNQLLIATRLSYGP